MFSQVAQIHVEQLAQSLASVWVASRAALLLFARVLDPVPYAAAAMVGIGKQDLA